MCVFVKQKNEKTNENFVSLLCCLKFPTGRTVTLSFLLVGGYFNLFLGQTLMQTPHTLPLPTSWKCSFIYLEHLIKLIARATGVSVDLTDLHAIPMFKHILVTNARRPKSWENPVEYVRALNLSLPRWTIKEFFHQIELFFQNNFNCIVILNVILCKGVVPYSATAFLCSNVG